MSSEGAVNICTHDDPCCVKEMIHTAPLTSPPLPRPLPGARVTVKYDAWKKNSEGLVSIEKARELSFVLGDGAVVDGLDLCVASMVVGEKAKVTVPPHHGFGDLGSKPSVGSQETLVFEVELLKFDNEVTSAAELVTKGNVMKNAGNDFYKAGKFDAAFKQYEAALDLMRFYFPADDSDRKTVNQLKVPCLLNQAACLLQLEDFSRAKIACDKALFIDSKLVKALFRRSQAYLGMQEFAKAKNDIVKAINAEPNNKELREVYASIKTKWEEFNVRKDEMEKKMAQGIQSEDTDATTSS